jgi:hypothetical protein
MSSFPLNDTETFFQSAKTFFEFLTQPTTTTSAGKNKDFWHNKMDLQEYLTLLSHDSLLKSILNDTILPSLLSPLAPALVPSPAIPLTASDSTVNTSSYAPVVPSSTLNDLVKDRGRTNHRILGAKFNIKQNNPKKGMVFQGKEDEVSPDEARQHITQHVLSPDNRTKHLNELRNDAVFAPLMNLIRDILTYSSGSGGSARCREQD